jgi:hypothetical protein
VDPVILRNRLLDGYFEFPCMREEPSSYQTYKPENILEVLESDFNRLIFVPSAHVGPCLGHYHQNDNSYIIFGARLPMGAALDAPDLSRNKIVVRLNAPADDMRLRILHTIALNGKQCSQDIICVRGRI